MKYLKQIFLDIWACIQATAKNWRYFVFVLFLSAMAQADDGWTITHYCSCRKCCGKSDGITASGKPAQDGMIALNWLPFGTKVSIDGKTYTVQDRGSKKLFGDKKNHIKRLDIWCSSHEIALKKGIRKNVKVEIKENEKCVNFSV